MTHKSVKVLWICPNLNHYKYKYLNYLNSRSEIDVTILKGSGRDSLGDIKMPFELPIRIIDVKVSKKYFGFSKQVRKIIKNIFQEYDYIMIPRERKNIILIIYSYFIRKNTNIKFFSYNHPISYKGIRPNLLDKLITRFLHLLYDKIIFYTKQSMEKALTMSLINPNRAFFANNTIFTKEVDSVYEFSIPSSDKVKILFIGRLIENKNLKLLFEYFFELKNILNKKDKIIELEIIGDGPLRDLVIENTKKDQSIKWIGALESESEIKKYMTSANFIFNPGHSGLHINHAFSYGRPYITIYRPNHAPEVDYLKDGFNGYMLDGNRSSDLDKLSSIFLQNDNKIYQNAYMTGKDLSIDSWCNQIVDALKA